MKFNSLFFLGAGLLVLACSKPVTDVGANYQYNPVSVYSNLGSITDFTGQGTGSTVHLTWNISDASAEAKIQLQKKRTDSVNFTTLAELENTVSSYDASGLESGKGYDFRIRLFSDTDQPDFSDPITIFTEDVAGGSLYPLAPTWNSLTATAYNKIDLSWSYNGPAISSLKIYRAQIGSNAAETSLELGPNETSYSDEGLSTGGLGTLSPTAEYKYRIVAINDEGQTASEERTVQLPEGPLGKVLNFDATTTVYQEITLTWTKSNDPRATAYSIERSEDNVTFSPIAELGATVSTYKDMFPNINNPVTRFYRIRVKGLSSSMNVIYSDYTVSIAGTAAAASANRLNKPTVPTLGTPIPVPAYPTAKCFTIASSWTGSGNQSSFFDGIIFEESANSSSTYNTVTVNNGQLCRTPGTYRYRAYAKSKNRAVYNHSLPSDAQQIIVP